MTRPKALTLAAAVHLAALSAAPAAFAQSAPAPASGPQPDVIYLKSGGMYRGTIVDAVYNERARIQLVTGEIATIPWSDIDRIEHEHEHRSPASGGPARAPEAKAPGPAVVVHVEGADDARLQQDTTGDDDWVTVCAAPCDKAIATAFSYRIVGESIRASRPFTLHGESGGHEQLHLIPSSKGAFVGGMVGAIAGASVAYAGLTVAYVGVLANEGTVRLGTTNPDTLINGGLVAVGVGAVVAVIGLVVLLNNRSTTVSQDVREPAAASPSRWLVPALAADDARRTLTAGAGGAFPKAIGIPLFTGSF